MTTVPKLVLKVVLSLACASAATAAGPRPPDNRTIAVQSMTDVFANRDLTAIDRYFAEPYIQHRTDLGNGLKDMRGLFDKIFADRPAFSNNVYRSIVDGDMVMLHSVYEGSPRSADELLAAFDLFRIKDGRIVEHWDALMPMGERNAAGHTAVDGPALIADLGRTEANRALVRKFTATVLAGGQVDRAGEFIDGKRYFEHSQGAGDGLEAFKARARSYQRAGYKAHRILAEGNFVVVLAEGAGGAQILYDLYRLQGGKLVEHWDVQAPVAPRAQWQNDNGPF